MPSGRLELQSYVAAGNDSYLQYKAHNLGGGRLDIDHSNRHGHDDPRWFSVSRAYMDDNDDDNASQVYAHKVSQAKHNLAGQGLLPSGNNHHGRRNQPYMDDEDENFDIIHAHHGNNSHSHGIYNADDRLQHEHHSHHDTRKSNSHLYNETQLVSVQTEEADEEEIEEGIRPVGLFSLFKYSTKFDMFLIVLGCLGALINGGSLPWFSYFFGDFVNNIAKASSDPDRTKMMKEVNKVPNFPPFADDNLFST